MADNPVITAIVSAGGGTVIGSLMVAILQTWGHRGEARAAAADTITHAAGEMVARLDRENRDLRKAVALIADVLDEVLPMVEAPPDAIQKLKAARKTLLSL